MGFKKGEEVFISYGDLSNLETLCNYGFVDMENIFNTEFVTVQMIRKSPVRVIIDDQRDGAIDSNSVAILRSYLASPEEIASSNGLFNEPIADEEGVYSLIASFVDEAIYDGKHGIAWAKENHDTLLQNYFIARVNVLNKGLEFIQKKFPDILY